MTLLHVNPVTYTDKHVGRTTCRAASLMGGFHGVFSSCPQCVSGLQNDHKAVMAQIEEALHRLHAQEKAKRERDEAEADEEALERQVTPPRPFARVDAVVEGSPACRAVSDLTPG